MVGWEGLEPHYVRVLRGEKARTVTTEPKQYGIKARQAHGI